MTLHRLFLLPPRKRVAAFLLFLSACLLSPLPAAAEIAGHEVLVHGLGRGDGALYWLERRLEDEGNWAPGMAASCIPSARPTTRLA